MESINQFNFFNSHSNLHLYTLYQGSSCMASMLLQATSVAPRSSTSWTIQVGCCQSACSSSTGSQDLSWSHRRSDNGCFHLEPPSASELTILYTSSRTPTPPCPQVWRRTFFLASLSNSSASLLPNRTISPSHEEEGVTWCVQVPMSWRSLRIADKNQTRYAISCWMSGKYRTCHELFLLISSEVHFSRVFGGIYISFHQDIKYLSHWQSIGYI